MIGRSNSAYCGPNWSMTVPLSSIRYRSWPSRHRPTGRRSDTNTSMVDGSTRRSATSATHGESVRRRRNASRSALRMLVPRRSSTSACTWPLDSRTLPVTAIFLTRSSGVVNARATVW